MPGIWELLVILLIVALLFGTKKLRSMGGDLGSAIKSFRGAIKDKSDADDSSTSNNNAEGEVIEGKVESDNEEPTKN